MSRITRTLAALLLVGAVSFAFATLDAQELITEQCDAICDKPGSTWGCYTGDRCCWEHIEGGSCGEGARTECTSCYSGPGGF